MYHNSSQKEFWTFTNEQEIYELWKEADHKYRSEYCSRNENINFLDNNFFLTFEEHLVIARYYEGQLKEFCNKFTPKMPYNTIGTACAFMKRLYTRTTVMEYHPKITFLVCAWLACKIEEFNVSMEEFIANITWNVDRKKTVTAIIDLELVVMQQLNYQLTVHNSFRPLEGLMIDVKTRYQPNLQNPQQDYAHIHQYANQFLFASLQTNASLLFSPSQVALAALLVGFSKAKLNVDQYLIKVLFAGQSQQMLNEQVGKLRKIRKLVNANAKLQIPPEKLQPLKAKLDKCYSKDKDPTSDQYAGVVLDKPAAVAPEKRNQEEHSGEPDSKRYREDTDQPQDDAVDQPHRFASMEYE